MNFKTLIKIVLMYFNKSKVNAVFVVGCGHSGTSIMLSLLDNHSQIFAVKHESSIFFKNKNTVLISIFDWYRKAKFFKKKIIAEKTPAHIYKIERIFDILPKSKIILMMRDGRDVACSIKQRTGDFELGVKRWIDDNSQADKFRKDPRLLEIKLEDMVANPTVTMEKVCNFLSIEYNSMMLENQGKNQKLYYTNILTSKSDFENLDQSHQKHLNRRNWQINQGLFSKTNRWQEEMTPEEIHLFNSLAKEYLVKYGYI